MYLKSQPNSTNDFEKNSAIRLSQENRWVILAQIIPWSEFEKDYAQNFTEKTGAPAKPFRMALGSLIIKEKLGISDEETVEQIRENPYLQYLIGLESYQDKAPFEASTMVHFRKRINLDLVNKINKKVLKDSEESECKLCEGEEKYSDEDEVKKKRKIEEN
jgi:hypothetical protein